MVCVKAATTSQTGFCSDEEGGSSSLGTSLGGLYSVLCSTKHLCDLGKALQACLYCVSGRSSGGQIWAYLTHSLPTHIPTYCKALEGKNFTCECALVFALEPLVSRRSNSGLCREAWNSLTDQFLSLECFRWLGWMGHPILAQAPATDTVQTTHSLYISDPHP